MNSHERNFLRKRAHELKPVVMVGKSGHDERVNAALREALAVHELVKVKFQDHLDECRSIAEELATATDSEVVTVLGHVATLFKQNPDPAKRIVHIPKEVRS